MISFDFLDFMETRGVEAYSSKDFQKKKRPWKFPDNKPGRPTDVGASKHDFLKRSCGKISGSDKYIAVFMDIFIFTGAGSYHYSHTSLGLK